MWSTADYALLRREFTWDAAWRELGVRPDGALNVASLALGRATARPGPVLRFLDAEGGRDELDGAGLTARVDRFVNALAARGIGRGAAVATLLGRGPELFVTALGAIKAGAAYCPLFSAFGPEPVQTRLELGAIAVLVTSESLYRRKVAPIRARLPALRHVFVVRARGATGALPENTVDFAAELQAQADSAPAAATTAADPALLHFTSGTTGKPKGVLHVHGAVVAQYASARIALDLRDGDTYWCTADPGWVTGTVYGVIAPLLCGVTAVVDREEFDVTRWYGILESERVNVWYTAPTAIRMLMKAGDAPLAGRRLPALRYACSVGEPLNPEAVLWGRDALGHAFHDNWWQTETGAIMIANYPGLAIRPGSMGKPLPGIEAAIVERLADGAVRELAAPDVPGELALRAGWPSMFREYLGNPGKYRACFAGPWYLTGDLARRDADGYFWFVGRADDVIKSAGHLVSPFEVESALLAHPAVAQAAVIGLPDPMLFQKIKAFVELKPGFGGGDAAATEALRGALLGHARKALGAAVAPRELAFVESIPRTRSGKILRRLLRARELGLPEGDLSTLEGTAAAAPEASP
jgi:acetyl-CoA synthetase